MTIFIPAGAVSVAMRVRPLVGNLYGYITCGFRGGQEDDPETVAAYAATAMLDELGPLLCHDCEMGEYVATVQVGDSNPTFVGGTMATGGGNFESVPPSSSVLVRKVTNTYGRQGRGRMFLPWFADETNVGESGDISGTTTNAISLAFQDIIQELDGDGITPVVFHQVGAEVEEPSYISSFQVESTLATQRRRQRR